MLKRNVSIIDQIVRMTSHHRLPSFLLLAFTILLGLSNSGRAEDHTYTFTGTGQNGSLASGTFTVADPMIVPSYVGDSTIFSAFSLTITNIPQGPGTLTLGREQDGGSYQSGTTYFVDNSGTIMLAPAGDYYPNGPGPGEQRVYQLRVNTDPGPLISDLYYSNPELNGVFLIDHIAWSPAIAAVPEPSTWIVGALSCFIVIGCSRRRLVFKSHGRGP